MPDDQTILLTDALKRLKRIERRLIGSNSAALNATKNADRLVLANDLDSIRLDIDHVIGSLENEIDVRAQESGR
jgi:hypothetical protein